MKEDKYVAAVEISSSKIIAVVGKSRPGGQLDIIAAEQEKGGDSVRYGMIQNIDETSMRLNRVLDRLQRKPAVAPRHISGLFVGLSGRSFRSIMTRVSLSLPDETEISTEILERLNAQARATAIDSSLEIIDAVPRSYKVGMNETPTPKGEVGNKITADYDLVVCRPEIKRNLVRTIEEKSKVKIKGMVVTPLAAGSLILTAEQKRLGCMLVDMGAETTTVTIYKDGHLVYYATLPLGGRNITRDLTSLNGVLEERAEEIKITSGHALPRDTVSNLNYHGVRDSDVSALIVARSEEIVVNIIKQISYADLKDTDLSAGIICIGGGAHLNGIIDLLANKSYLPVTRGALPSYVRVEDLKVKSADIIEVASVLYAGAMADPEAVCLESPSANPLPVTGEANPQASSDVANGENNADDTPKPSKPKKPSIFSKLGKGISGFFAGNDDDDDDVFD